MMYSSVKSNGLELDALSYLYFSMALIRVLYEFSWLVNELLLLYVFCAWEILLLKSLSPTPEPVPATERALLIAFPRYVCTRFNALASSFIYILM